MLPLTEIKIGKKNSQNNCPLVKYCLLSAEFTMNELPMKHQSKMFLKNPITNSIVAHDLNFTHRHPFQKGNCSHCLSFHYFSDCYF